MNVTCVQFPEIYNGNFKIHRRDSADPAPASRQSPVLEKLIRPKGKPFHYIFVNLIYVTLQKKGEDDFLLFLSSASNKYKAFFALCLELF